MGNDNLSIISFNSSRKGLLTLSPGQRPYYLKSLFEEAEPDICFLPGDDKRAKLNVIRGYEQFTLQHNDDTVLLYNSNKVSMTKPQFSLNAFGALPGLDFDKLVVPLVEVSTLKPYKRPVKKFSLVSWKFDLFETVSKTASIPADTLVESIITFSQRLALTTGEPVLIGGEMRINHNILKQIVNKLSSDKQEEFLSNLQPVMCEQAFLPSVTKTSLRDVRHLFFMKVFRCEPESSKVMEESKPQNQVVADCFIASKQLHLEDASLLDVEKVTGREIRMPLLKQHKPTQTKMEIPVRPPRHHGG